MSRIIIVSEVFYPDRTTTAHILTKIATVLGRTHDVMVICGPADYDGAEPEIVDNVLTGVGIVRIRQRHFDKNNILQRSVKFISLSFAIVWQLIREAKPGDDVIVVTNPAPLMVLVGCIKRLKKFSLTILVHDVFPENTIPAGIFKNRRNLFYKLIRFVFNHAYRRADRLIVLGRDMKEVILEKVKRRLSSVSVEIIENWSDTPQHAVQTPEQMVDSPIINILYAGNIGRVQGLDAFIDAFNGAGNCKLLLSIRGSGAALPKLRERIAAERPYNVVYGGPYTKAEQFDVLATCDIALVTLADGMFGLGVPSKAYNILQAGKPILYVGDPRSEIALIVKENNIGFCFAPGQGKELSAFLAGIDEKIRPLLCEMGTRAHHLAITEYSEDKVLAKYQRLYNTL